MTRPPRSRADPPQPGNPHELSRRQHVFPVKSIKRFVRAGGVDLYDVPRRIQRWARATDALFCADRSWNHGAEIGFMKDIEDAFQALIVEVLNGRDRAFDKDEVAVISEFYALWNARTVRRTLPTQYVRPNGIVGVSHHRSPDDLERLEKHNIMGIRPDGSFLMRDFMGSVIYLEIDRITQSLAASTWGLVASTEGHFCVPDIPWHGIIPVTASLALVVNTPSGRISRANLAEVNAAMVAGCRDYVFATDLAECPGVVIKT